ncbi:MAG TPA: hypothetical protein VN884_01450 [Candidatus Sulfotelmatobacter sp.]|nr:hypothetical protein [Candidatus Sulfotelmatobacter sp.]
MKIKTWLICAGLLALTPCAIFAQARKPLTNEDIVSMTKQGFDAPLIEKAIQTGDNNFDLSAQALVDLKNAGVSQDVMAAMLSAHGNEPSGPVVVAVPAAVVIPNAATMDASKRLCTPGSGCLLREGDQVPLKFANDLNSKTAADGDTVEFILDDDLKVGDTIVVAKGAHALANVTNVKRAGMMGKPGELDVQLQYLVAGDTRIRIRGTKGREGQSATGATVALTVLFGPIGLIKHGKEVDMPAGTPLVAYVDQDISLPPIK